MHLPNCHDCFTHITMHKTELCRHFSTQSQSTYRPETIFYISTILIIFSHGEDSFFRYIISEQEAGGDRGASR